MIKKLLVLTTLGLLLSGCFIAPMALVGPAASGFSTASIAQSALTTGANFVVKRSTGKTISQHAFETINNEILQQSYFPEKKNKIISEK
tara:strand:+ start:113 stop:379 length:267 start_codon:yes stop_codon:yes gene_type:complete